MAILEVENLYKSFQNTKVLKGVSFSLEEGKVLSIIGSSGSGKTTLLRCITSLESADSGKITVNDEVVFDSEDRKKLSPAEKRRRQLSVGLVFQSFNLFPQYTALQNVKLALELRAKEEPTFRQNKKAVLEKIDSDARRLLGKVGLTEKLGNFPCELSGGQQQRVSIARAMALEPKILFFDEPTSALDPELTGEILRVIKELANENMTMVIVTHEMAFARAVSSKIIFMDDGVISLSGTPEEVFDNTDNKRIQEFLQKYDAE